MKRTLLFAAIACMAGSVANAQELVIDNWKGKSDGFEVLPKALTSTNQPILMSSERDEEKGQHTFTLYNADLSVSKTFNCSLPSYKYLSDQEIATVKPTGSHVELLEKYDNGSADDLETDFSGVSSSEDLVAVLKKAWDRDLSDDQIIPYTDSEGHFGVVFTITKNYDEYFYEYSTFGKKYPLYYRALIDGELRIIVNSYGIQYEYPIPSTTDEDGRITYSPEGVTWEREKRDDDNDETRYGYLDHIYYYDYDNNAGYLQAALITQNLFNNDSKWEYLAPILEEYTEYGTPSTYNVYDENGDYTDDGGNLHFRRSVYHSAHTIGYKVMSENGNTIMTLKGKHANCTHFSIDGIFILGGKKYIRTDERYTDDKGEDQSVATLYLFDTYTTSVKEVSSVKVRPQMGKVSGDGIDVTLDEGDTDSDLILSNMAGQVLDRKHVAKGETKARMKAAGMPKGVYNLTLRRQGHVLNNQKLMIK